MIKDIVRWILVMPVSLLGFALAFLAGLAVMSALDSFCPTEWRVSGMCMWQPHWIGDLPIVFGAGLAAFLMVILAALLAPAHKVRVAWGIYGFGALYAAYASYSSLRILSAFSGAPATAQTSTGASIWLPLSTALVFGLYAVVLVRRSQRAAITIGANGEMAAKD